MVNFIFKKKKKKKKKFHITFNVLKRALTAPFCFVWLIYEGLLQRALCARQLWTLLWIVANRFLATYHCIGNRYKSIRNVCITQIVPSNVWCGAMRYINLSGNEIRGIWVLRPFQEYFSYIQPIVHQRWAKTRGPRGKNHLPSVSRTWLSHMTRARLEPQRWETLWIQSPR